MSVEQKKIALMTGQQARFVADLRHYVLSTCESMELSLVEASAGLDMLRIELLGNASQAMQKHAQQQQGPKIVAPPAGFSSALNKKRCN